MSNLITSQEGQVYYISLNRPEVFNSFDMRMSKELQDELDHCSQSDEIRAVVIRAIGKAFSSGQDLKEATAPDAPDMKTIITEQYNPIIRKITQCPKPIIAAVQGVAAGAGANIALCCDIVLAAQSASFIQAFSKIGLIPDSGGSYFLPRLIGVQRSIGLMMTGERVTAQDALQMGMIYKVFDDIDFTKQVELFAHTISQMPTRALSHIKELVYQSLDNNLEQQLLCELKYQQLCGNTQDYKEGVCAFIEKRKPVFKGN
ncbi:MAG: enoyl-CoA hydratase/isomerase family protein [Saprospiraceae bacterium]|nr:enoyl-CoA hydratase/isomerase family protein [Saprospiraceae bacterium]